MCDVWGRAGQLFCGINDGASVMTGLKLCILWLHRSLLYCTRSPHQELARAKSKLLEALAGFLALLKDGVVP